MHNMEAYHGPGAGEAASPSSLSRPSASLIPIPSNMFLHDYIVIHIDGQVYLVISRFIFHHLKVSCGETPFVYSSTRRRLATRPD